MSLNSPRELVEARQTIERFRSHGFEIVREQFDAGNFGNVLLDLSSKELDLRYIRDRGQHFVDIRRPGDSEWFNEYIVLTFVGASEDAEALVLERWKSAEPAAAIERNLTAILDAFGPLKYEATKSGLRSLEREGARRRFGYEVPPN